MENYQIIGTNQYEDVAEDIYDKMSLPNVKLGNMSTDFFPNGEQNIKIHSNVRGSEVYLLHSMAQPDPDKAFMTALLSLDALKNADAKGVTLILPYMSYLRQDRREDGRVPISGEVLCRTLTTNPLVKKVVTIDMHAPQADGFMQTPVVHIPGRYLFKDYLQNTFNEDYSSVEVVSPDYGSAKRVDKLAKMLSKDLSTNVFGKIRTNEGTETLEYVGRDLKGKTVVMYDDQIDTGGTILGAAKRCFDKGAKDVLLLSPHWLGTTKYDSNKKCEEKFAESKAKVITTNSIPRSNKYYNTNKDWMTMIPIQEKLVDIIKTLSTPQGSVSEVMKKW